MKNLNILKNNNVTNKTAYKSSNVNACCCCNCCFKNKQNYSFFDVD